MIRSRRADRVKRIGKAMRPGSLSAALYKLGVKPLNVAKVEVYKSGKVSEAERTFASRNGRYLALQRALDGWTSAYNRWIGAVEWLAKLLRRCLIISLVCLVAAFFFAPRGVDVVMWTVVGICACVLVLFLAFIGVGELFLAYERRKRRALAAEGKGCALIIWLHDDVHSFGSLYIVPKSFRKLANTIKEQAPYCSVLIEYASPYKLLPGMLWPRCDTASFLTVCYGEQRYYVAARNEQGEITTDAFR